MKHSIKIYYVTGNSFGSEDTEDVLEMTWDNLDIAKLNLKRIEEHYKWYTDKNNSYRWNKNVVEEPEWHKGIEYDFVLILIADNGNEMRMTAFWCGYFETLKMAEIVSIDSDLRIEF